MQPGIVLLGIVSNRMLVLYVVSITCSEYDNGTPKTEKNEDLKPLEPQDSIAAAYARIFDLEAHI